MTTVVYPPTSSPPRDPILVDVFLAGSIEMGIAEQWQDPLCNVLLDLECIRNIYNPRRPEFDATQKQSIDNEYFNGQVNWELNNLESSAVIFMFFDPNTKSPISLMELGYLLGRLQAHDPHREHIKPSLVVCCPDGFWRQGNVEIMLSRAGIPMFKDYDAAIKILLDKVWTKHRELANFYNYAPFQAPFECAREFELYDGRRGKKPAVEVKNPKELNQ